MLSNEINNNNNMIHEFIKDVNTDNKSINNSNICTRFIQKKYKCIIIFLIFIVAFFEILNNILTKIDESTIKIILHNLFNVTQMNKTWFN